MKNSTHYQKYSNNTFSTIKLPQYSFRDIENYFSKLGSDAIENIMIVVQLIAFLFQIIRFYKTKSSRGFSKFICLFLFLGNALRISLCLGTNFKKGILYQSTAIVILQVILIHLSIKYQEDSLNSSKLELHEIKSNDKQLNLENKNNINIIKNFIAAYFSKTFKPKYFRCLFCFKGLNTTHFWDWTEEKQYYKYMLSILLLLLPLMAVFKKNELFLKIINLLSILFISLFCLPQIISTYKSKVTRNISFLMFLFCFLVDTFKLFFYIKYKAQKQLILGVWIQIVLEMILLFQIVLYRNNTFKEKNRMISNKKQIDEINQLMKSIDELNIGK
jgi:uncharacterized protein with PQ loop repeat